MWVQSKEKNICRLLPVVSSLQNLTHGHKVSQQVHFQILPRMRKMIYSLTQKESSSHRITVLQTGHPPAPIFMLELSRLPEPYHLIPILQVLQSGLMGHGSTETHL